MNQVNSLMKIFMLLWLILIVLFLILSSFFFVIFASLIAVLCAIYVQYAKFESHSDADLDSILGPNPLDNNFNGSFITTVAHRGACLDAPENSLVAFQMCAEKRCKIVEFDVTKTFDDIPIVFHDNDISRLTGEKGIVEQMTWSEISSLDISINHSLKHQFSPIYIAKLNDAVEKCTQLNLKMIFDVKSNNLIVLSAICDQFKKHSLYSKAIVTSFFPHIIYKIRKLDPEIVCALTWRPNCHSNTPFSFDPNTVPAFDATIPQYKKLLNKLYDFVNKLVILHVLYYFLGVRILLLSKEVINGNMVFDWYQKGVRILAWTVNDPIEKQYFSQRLRVTYLTDTLTVETGNRA